MVDKIKIYDKDYPIKFGHGATKLFCQLKGIDTLSDYFNFLKKLDFTNLSFDTMEQIAQLTKCAIDSGCALSGKENDLTSEMIFEWFGDDFTAMPRAIDLLTKSLPKVDDKKKRTVEKMKS